MFNRNRQDFYETLAALLSIGKAPLGDIVTSLAQCESDWFFGRALRKISIDMANGAGFHSALMRHPIAFPRIDAELLRYTGEGEPFQGLLRSLAQLSAVRKPLWKSVIAACIGVLITTGNLFFLMFLIVPMFEEMFVEMLAGEPLPALTRWYVAASHLFTHNTTQLFIGVTLAALVYIGVRFCSSDRFINPLYNILPFSHTSGLERDCQKACQRLSVLAQNGTHINHALELTAKATETHLLHRHMNTWLRHVKNNIPLEAAVNIEPARKGPIQLLQDTLSTPFGEAVLNELQKLVIVYEERSKLRSAPLPISPFTLVALINFFLLGSCILAMFMPLIKLTECLC